MEKLRRVVKEIAYSPCHSNLPTLHRSLIPLLSITSSLYALALSIRSCLYRYGLFSQTKLPVGVMSVGNLTWGGNGKTPMVEYIARWLSDSGISPLILTRGFAGGDEARMLQRHLIGRNVKIGVGANRTAVAASFFEKYGKCDALPIDACSERESLDHKVGDYIDTEKIGVTILDDGMQHWRLWRDLEIVMVNGLMPWGNCQLLPLGPLREPLRALSRADIAVIHNADLVSEQKLGDLALTMQSIKNALPIYFTRMVPSCLFEAENINSKLPLVTLHNAVVLCVSGIGSSSAFVQAVEKIGASFVENHDFSDHHLFQETDINAIAKRLKELEKNFRTRPIVVVTEKDYDRGPECLRGLNPFKVLVLCSELQIISYKGRTEDSFKLLLKELLAAKQLTTNWISVPYV
ncbi:hypothetical protein ACFE04_023459 [Oxalis oulophora]